MIFHINNGLQIEIRYTTLWNGPETERTLTNWGVPKAWARFNCDAYKGVWKKVVGNPDDIVLHSTTSSHVAALKLFEPTKYDRPIECSEDTSKMTEP